MQLETFGFNKDSFLGLVTYMIIGGITFLVDISIIFFCVHKLHIHYPIAVGIGFILGAFFNYAMNRAFVFTETDQSHIIAMSYFLAIAFGWLWFTIGGTVLLVEKFHLHLIVSRTLVGLVVAVGGFILNSLVTFRSPKSQG